MAYRVIQWTTGNVGRQTLKALIAKPGFELVGVFAHGRDKVGRDAAELCGLDTPTGICATDDVEALLRSGADACVFSGRWFDVDLVCRLLEAGINVVTHAAFINGRWLGEDARHRLQEACIKGAASLYGSGINPGFANIIAVVSTQLCARVDQIRVTEAVDSTYYDSWETEVKVGFGQKPDAPGLVENAREATEVFGDAVEMMADALGVVLDEIVFDMDTALATARNELGYATIEEGTVSAVDGRWRGRIGGRDFIVLRFRWKKGTHVEPFEIDGGYRIEVDGNPSVLATAHLQRPVPQTDGDAMAVGMIATGLPALNAIPSAVAAQPGIVAMHQMNAFGACDVFSF
ncbi:hypothetical protein [Novosphingobium pentaromativorans]|uniref:2,4-diaminopentanoate dehydrogenase C-terminal domain-containing protein n=1 Tax=Novosphingobium pentaromativorans US6-1 TaxID=1088721 RepID=G6EAS4_9SPHN|nr:hypothetical protein [Novosphingobium pentaromativorans]EHJ61711.1 hypothetical protein NSU_1472 [Novosphingobium pentaromativorans US6-1]